MSLFSTFTNDSINGWRAPAGGYIAGSIIFPSSSIPANSNFGYNCVISGDGTRCVVKSWYAVSGTNTSTTYVFLKNPDGTWSQETILTTISYNTDVPMAINYTGDVIAMPVFPNLLRIYTRSGTTWSLTQTITKSDNTQLARSIVITNGNYIFEGQPNYNGSRGRVIVYSQSGSTWSAIETLIASDQTAGAQFGSAVAVSNDTNYIIVGAPGTNSNNGAVYVFSGSLTTWTQQTKINSPYGTNNAGSAQSVATNNDGSYLSFGYESTGAPASRIWIYTRSGTTWSLQQTLYSNGTPTTDGFSQAIKMSQDATVLAASAGYETVSGSTFAGRIYIFNRIGNSWVTQQTLTTNPVQANSFLTRGYGLDLTNDSSTIIGGAPGMNTYGANTGVVFSFTNT